MTKGFLVPAPFFSLPGPTPGREGVYSHTWVSCFWRGGGVPEGGLAVVPVLPESLLAVGTGLSDCLSGRESLPCRPR